MATSPTRRRDGRSLKQIFENYDANQTGALEVEECRAMLADLGLLVSGARASADARARAHRDVGAGQLSNPTSLLLHSTPV